MYRHFAAVTVFVTAVLAIATSDSPLAPTPTVAATKPNKPSAPAYGEARLVRRSAAVAPAATRGWAPEDTFEEPLDPGLSFGDGFVTAPGEAIDGLDLTPEQIARLSPEERERLLRERAAQTAPVDAAERRAQARRISEASLRRSGGSE